MDGSGCLGYELVDPQHILNGFQECVLWCCEKYPGAPATAKDEWLRLNPIYDRLLEDCPKLKVDATVHHLKDGRIYKAHYAKNSDGRSEPVIVVEFYQNKLSILIDRFTFDASGAVVVKISPKIEPRLVRGSREWDEKFNTLPAKARQNRESLLTHAFA
jgi:hypothetical protein